MMALRKEGVVYTGITSELIRRVYEHKPGYYKGFSEKYNVKRLVYYEVHRDVKEAILREKQIKKWKRAWKIKLIEKDNPGWNDLYGKLI